MAQQIYTASVSVRKMIEKYLITSISDDVYLEITKKKPPTNQVKVFVDDSFQRKYGAWDTAKKSMYIASIFNNQIYTPIVLAEMNRDDNYKFSILDGMHRANVIAEFINDKFGFTGDVIMDSDEDGKPVVIPFKNKLFSNMSDRQKLVFTDSEIEIKFIPESLSNMLNEVFITINDGEPLNSQEKRNAVNCEIARWSRHLDEMNESVFKQITKVGASNNLQRMSAREFVSKVYGFIKNYKDPVLDHARLNDDLLDQYYSETYVMDENVKQYVNSLISSLEGTCRKLKKNKNKVIKMDQFWVYTILHSELFFEKSVSDLSGVSDELLWNLAVSTSDLLLKQSKKLEVDNFQSIEDGSMSKEDEEKVTYFHEEVRRFHTPQAMKYVIEEVKSHIASKNTALIDQVKELKVSEKMEEAEQAIANVSG